MESRCVNNLNISSQNVQIGNNNVLVVVRGIEEDPPDNSNTFSNISEVTLRSGDDKQLHYRASGATCVSFGNNCTIAEVILNKELVKDLQTGQLRVTTGDNLVSVTWYDNLSKSEEQAEAEHKTFKIKLLEDKNITDITEIEEQVFKRLVDCEDQTFVQLITELLNRYKARLKHIKMGCIELEFELESDNGSVNLQDKTEEIKDLLRRTIIPEGAVFDLEIQPSTVQATEGMSIPEPFENKKNDGKITEKDPAQNTNCSDTDYSSMVSGASPSFTPDQNNENKTVISKDDEIGYEGQDQRLETRDTNLMKESIIPIESPKDKTTGSVDVLTSSDKESAIGTSTDIEPYGASSDEAYSDVLDLRAIQLQIEDYLNDCLVGESEHCKYMILRELGKYISEERKRYTEMGESRCKFDIDVNKIQEKIDMKFEQFYSNLFNIIAVEAGKIFKRSRLGGYDEISDGRMQVSKWDGVFLSKTFPPRIQTERYEAERSCKDITDDILKRIEGHFQSATDVLREKVKSLVKYICEVKREEIKVNLKKENETFILKSLIYQMKRHGSPLHESELEDDWLETEQHIDKTIDRLVLKQSQSNTSYLLSLIYQLRKIQQLGLFNRAEFDSGFYLKTPNQI